MKMWKPALAILCCLFVVVSTSKAGSGYQPAPPRKEVNVEFADSSLCPACNMNPYNLSDEQAISKFAGLVPSIWNQSITLTDLGTRFVTLVKTLAANNLTSVSSQGILISIFTNKFIPYLSQQPDACYMTAVLNATIYCFLLHDSTGILKGLTQYENASLYDLNPLLERTIIHRSGCDLRCGEYPPDPKVNKTACYNNGLVYPIRAIWLFPRYRLYSSALKVLVFQMYDSSDFNDRFFAVCATFALLVTPIEFMNQNIGLEAIELALSSSIQPKCCYQRMERVEEIRKIKDAEAITYIATLKRVFEAVLCPIGIGSSS